MVEGHQFIDGSYAEGTSGVFSELVDPATGDVLDSVHLAGPADVDRAVSAAKRAFAEWSTATPSARASALTKLAALLAERADQFASIESRQTGKPIKLSTEFDVPGTIDNVAFFAGAARNLEGKAAGEYSADHTSIIRREPVGVVGSISPWNYPLQMAAWKILPAIAAGNTIVLKPAEITPLTSLMFAEACHDAGIPPGVVNVVTGRGADAGSHLVSHPHVSMVSFTGSTAVGVQVVQTAAKTIKRTHMVNLDTASYASETGAMRETICVPPFGCRVQKPPGSPHCDKSS